MEAARRLMQIIRFAMLSSLIVLFYISRAIPSRVTLNPTILVVLAIVALVDVVVLLAIRRAYVTRSAMILASDPENPAAIARWKSGQLITYALGEAVALYGIVLHFLGSTISQTALFFAGGVFIILIFPPTLPERAR